MNQLTTRIVLPAYNNQSRGLLIELTVHAYQSTHSSVQSNGYLAGCLHKNFKRSLNIIAAMSTQWHSLKNYSYIIDSSFVGGVVRETASSSLGLCIGILNLYRAINQQSQIGGITGTGILRVDGSFDEANLESAKQEAAEASALDNEHFVVPKHCRHLFDLEHLLEYLTLTKGKNYEETNS